MITPTASTPNAHDRIALSIYLCTVLHDAAADLYRLNPHDGPDPAALYARFLGWAAPRGDPASGVGHPE
ncbi:hypothetical protein [Micromonospora sp. WMMD710]|uniref:hypothetical protein n=1 Tax=Micromonospora sp. WMMD710 TaxID=3016085 RepID=UPI002415DFF0|nr:hypothetical protein [Micromonospora sp. WMMD710]MDG4761641.1 hypothetical protein [Micromonospora sp. WMMD710]